MAPSDTADTHPPSAPRRSPSALTLWEANILVAQLAGFWARKGDGHPGPDIMGRGLLILAALVQWEKTTQPKPAHRTPSRKPG